MNKTVLFLIILSVSQFIQGCYYEPSPGELAPKEPIQERVDEESWIHDGYTITTKASYKITARVLSIKKYNDDLAPLDFALGWKKMSDPIVYNQLNIRQSNRWYRYSWEDKPPIPAKEIIRSSANTHLIPKNKKVLSELKKIKEGAVIELEGYLVNVSKKDKRGEYSWISSLTRKDNGGGSCELMYVEKIKIIIE